MQAFCSCKRNQVENTHCHYAFTCLVSLAISILVSYFRLLILPYRYAKDIKTALLSADIIINKWGFRDFRLDIYGTIDKAPSYTTQCQEIIASKTLRHQVKLQGEADPLSVLEKTVCLHSSRDSYTATDFALVGVSQLLRFGGSSFSSRRSSAYRCSRRLHRCWCFITRPHQPG